MNKYFYQKAVIDTCVLLDSICLNYKEKSNNNNNILINKINQNFKSKDKYISKYFEFLDSKIIQYITSAYAIGELHGLFNSRYKISGDLLTMFWKMSIDYLSTKKLDEKLISILEINRKNSIPLEIGYVDISLIELAKSQNLTIITNDVRTLRHNAHNQLVQTFIPDEVLSDFQKLNKTHF